MCDDDKDLSIPWFSDEPRSLEYAVEILRLSNVDHLTFFSIDDESNGILLER